MTQRLEHTRQRVVNEFVKAGSAFVREMRRAQLVVARRTVLSAASATGVAKEVIRLVNVECPVSGATRITAMGTRLCARISGSRMGISAE